MVFFGLKRGLCHMDRWHKFYLPQELTPERDVESDSVAAALDQPRR